MGLAWRDLVGAVDLRPDGARADAVRLSGVSLSGLWRVRYVAVAVSLIRSETGRFRRGELPLTLVGAVWSVSLILIINTWHREPDQLMRGFLAWGLLPVSAILLYVGVGAWFRWLGRAIFVCGLGGAAGVVWAVYRMVTR